MPQSTICHPVPPWHCRNFVRNTAIVVGDIHQITDNVSEECARNDMFLYSGRRFKRQDVTECLLKGPWQPLDYNCPVTDGRSFQARWFKWTIRQRSWLSKQMTKHTACHVFCFRDVRDRKFGQHPVLTTGEMVDVISNDMKSQQSIEKQKLQKLTGGKGCQLMS